MIVSPKTAKWVRLLSFVFMAICIGFGTLSIIGSVARISAAEERSYAEVSQLEFDSEFGEVELRPSSSGLKVRRSISWSVARPRLEEQRSGGVLKLRDICPMVIGRGCSGKIIIEVPSGTSVMAHSSAGDVSAVGIAGNLNLSSSAGSVRATDLDSDRVRIDSSAGEVELSFRQAPQDVNVQCSAGGVRIFLPPVAEGYRVQARSSTGSATITVPTSDSSQRRVVAQSGAGNVRIAERR